MQQSRPAHAPGRGRAWAATRLVLGVGILAVLVWRLGAGPFVAGLQRVDAGVLAVGLVIAVPTTVCCAWRWRLVSRGLGVDLPLGTAVRAYYRSQFLNSVLPGGVLGDVHRAVRRGRDIGDLGQAGRAVGWERVAGQGVQIVLTVLALLVLPSPVREWMPGVTLALVLLALAVVLLGRALGRAGPARTARTVRAVAADLWAGVLSRRVWPGVVLASALVVAGHTVTFLVAARAAGSSAGAGTVLPLALLVLAATALPTNVAGWGPREGAAAWAFAAAGLGAAQGVATAVLYGVMALVAVLPGAVLLGVTWLRRGREPGRYGHELPVGAADPFVPGRPLPGAVRGGAGRG